MKQAGKSTEASKRAKPVRPPPKLAAGPDAGQQGRRAELAAAATKPKRTGVRAAPMAAGSAAAQKTKPAVALLARREVLAYLASHPTFFAGKDAKTQEVLLQLQIPHDDTPNTISLLEYQVNLWREKAEQSEMLHKTLAADLKHNQELIAQINQAVLNLMQAADLPSIGKLVEQIFVKDFKVESYKMALFGAPPKAKHYEQWQLGSLPRELITILNRRELVYGALSPLVQELFFGPAKSKYRSYLLAPLYSKRRVFGAICLASSAEFRFSRDLLTDYIDFLFDAIRIALDKNLV